MPFLGTVAPPPSGRSEAKQSNFRQRNYARREYRVRQRSGESEVEVEGVDHGSMSSIFSRRELGTFHEDLMFPRVSALGRRRRMGMGERGCVWQ